VNICLFDDLDGWRFHAIVTNLPGLFAPADMVEAHHRLRGGIPEDTIRQLKEDFGLIHAPVQNFFGNWPRIRARTQHRPLDPTLRFAPDVQTKRLRLAFFNVAARVVNHDSSGSPGLTPGQTREALTRIRALPAFA
jgi:hypothetical protein